MVAKAEVRHAIPGRMRLALVERKGEDEFFSEVERRIREIPGVTRVSGNPLTGSLTVEYTGRPKDLLASADAAAIFSCDSKPSNRLAERPRHRLRGRLDVLTGAWDDKLRSATGGEVDLGVVAFLGLGVMALRQFGRGKFLPAGLPLMMLAMSLLKAEESALSDEIETELEAADDGD